MIDLVSALIAGLSTVVAGVPVIAKLSYEAGHGKAVVRAAELQAEAARLTAKADDHGADVTLQEGNRKRITALESSNFRLQESLDQMRLDRESRQDEKFKLQREALEREAQLLGQVSSLQLQIGQLSEQLTHTSSQLTLAGAREAEMLAEIASLRAEVMMLRAELAKHQEQPKKEEPV